MPLKNLSKRTKLIIGFAGCALFAVFLFDFFPKFSILPTFAPVKHNQPEFGLPVHLEIPVISVEAPVEYVGLTSGGEMDVPKGPLDVAWYNLGPRPGKIGSAAIAGHFGYKNGKPSVFDNLHKLQKGDKVLIKDDKGVTITFVVREIQSFDPNADASSVFGSNDGKSHLNLITCEGIWDNVAKGYPKRLVVFTDKE